SQTEPSLFIADAATAVVSSLVIDPNGSVADGVTANVATATVLDAHNNPVSGINVSWTPAFDGTMRFSTTSGYTGIDGKMTVRITDTMSRSSPVGAVLENGSRMNATVVFVGDPTTAAVSSLTIDKDSSVANGVATNSATATVLDTHNNPVAGVTVAWTADKGTVNFGTQGTTDANGHVSVTFTDTVAETAQITATLGGGSQTEPSKFIADAATAVPSSLVIDPNGSVADGVTANVATVTVLDAHNNPVSGINVSWSPDSDGTMRFSPTSGVTGIDGKMTVRITDTRSRDTYIGVWVNGNYLSEIIEFVADPATAAVSSLTIDKNGSVANGVATNSATATVLDANNNPVSGAVVTWSADKGTVSFGTQGTTDANGHVSVTFTDTVAETAQITATLGGSSQTSPSRFVGDIATARVEMEISNSSGVAGKTTVGAIVTVVDANSNPVGGAVVTMSADKSTVTFAMGGDGFASTAAASEEQFTTNNGGTFTVYIADTVAEPVQVTATVGNSSQTKQIEFVAD
ncbi:TPA: Ig-like domain-containing protein, partial [Citrobacter freundii]|nr:Ig-like domain-containing protein [Citrobacter freundii]